MQIALEQVGGELDRLCARAQAGEEVTIVLQGSQAIRLIPVALAPMTPPAASEVSLANRRRALLDALAEAGRNATPGPSAARSQDFLYDDETGLPA